MENSILSALAYLIDKQSLTTKEIKAIIVKTKEELKNAN